MAESMERWKQVQVARTVHPLITVGALNLDFLCIHPFRDGNGRASRLLFLLGSYQAGLEVGRYISLERLIEQNKERSYEVLKLSSDGWHQGKYNPWPYISFLLYTLLDAYKEFERRVGETASPRGEKTELVLNAIHSQTSVFRLADMRECVRALGGTGFGRSCGGYGRRGKWSAKDAAPLPCGVGSASRCSTSWKM